MPAMPHTLSRLGAPARVAAVLIGLVAAAPAPAQTNLFLNRSMTEVMTKDDLRMLQGALNEALASASDGSVVTWNNPATGASGTVTPLKSSTQGGRACRVVETFTEARGRRGSGQWEFCKQGGNWQLR
jgi:surface antigen